MNSQQESDLRLLRDATPTRNWISREAPLKSLLLELGVEETAKLVLHIAENYLPEYKKSHPASVRIDDYYL